MHGTFSFVLFFDTLIKEVVKIEKVGQVNVQAIICRLDLNDDLYKRGVERTPRQC